MNKLDRTVLYIGAAAAVAVLVWRIVDAVKKD